MKKKVILIFVLLFILVLTGIGFLIIFGPLVKCNDGTLHEQCSDIKPYYCFKGDLIKKASICGCSNVSMVNGDICYFPYETEPKLITLNYTLRGKKNKIDFIVYKGLYDYLGTLPRYSSSSKNFTLLDFKLKMIDNPYQKELLLPLVLEIQKITPNKDDQARIAISLVQNIPFKESGKISTLLGFPIEYQRYPYEVLYEMEGVCGEKSSLLVFLLKELGYGTSYLYYNLENHEAVGIKCPYEHGVDGSEYCFIETTGPSIISDDKIEYVNLLKLKSDPLIFNVSDGLSLGKYEQEYVDAKNLDKIRQSVRKGNSLNIVQYLQFQILKSRYGLSLN